MQLKFNRDNRGNICNVNGEAHFTYKTFLLLRLPKVFYWLTALVIIMLIGAFCFCFWFYLKIKEKNTPCIEIKKEQEIEYKLGPNGGVYYLDKNGKKSYVDREFGLKKLEEQKRNKKE